MQSYVSTFVSRVLCVCMFTAAPLLSDKAFSHGKPTPKKKEPVHSHSKWSLDLGASVTKSTDTSANDASGDAAAPGDDHSSHTGLRLLSEGADHVEGESGDTSGSGTAGPAFDPVFTVKTQYDPRSKFGFIGLASYAFTGGIIDPEAGITSFSKFQRNLANQTTFTASYPASEYSQKNFKLTTLKITSGPTLQIRRYSLGIQALAAYAWYKKTVIYRAEEESTQLTLLQEGDYGEVIGPIDNNLAASDREFRRIGARMNGGYRYSSRIKLDSSFGIFKISHQFSADSWLSQLTVVQVSYLVSSISTYASFLLTEESDNFRFPTQSAISVGIGYRFF